jgi:hypothetical protein
VKKTLTLKDLGHVEENGRFRLCPSYANTRNDFKVIEDYVIGYTLVGDGYRSHVRVAPMYRAAIWSREGKVRRVTSSYSIGDYLNADPHYDQVGNALATSVHMSIIGLLHRAEERKAQEKNNGRRSGIRAKPQPRADGQAKGKREARRLVGNARRKSRPG